MKLYVYIFKISIHYLVLNYTNLPDFIQNFKDHKLQKIPRSQNFLGKNITQGSINGIQIWMLINFTNF